MGKEKGKTIYLFIRFFAACYFVAMLAFSFVNFTITLIMLAPLVALLIAVIIILAMKSKSAKGQFLRELKYKQYSKTTLRDRIFKNIFLYSPSGFEVLVLNRLPYKLKKERFDYKQQDFSFVGAWDGKTIELDIDNKGATIAFNEETDNGIIVEIPFSYFHKADSIGFYETLTDCLTHVRSEDEQQTAIEYFKNRRDFKEKTYGVILKERHNTYLKTIFEAMEHKQKDYNWLVTGHELYLCEMNIKDEEVEKVFEYKNGERYVFISGDELTKAMHEEDVQWIFGSFSAFNKSIAKGEILSGKYFMPGTEYDDRYMDSTFLQHQLAEIEIGAFDGAYTVIKSTSKEIIDTILKNRPSVVGFDDFFDSLK